MQQTEFAHLQLHINCIVDENYGTRNKGLKQIEKETMGMEKDQLLRLYNDTKLTPFLTKVIADSRQMNRQLALKLIQNLIKKTGGDGRSLYEVFLPALIQRVNETPFPEASENVRLRVTQIFYKLIPYKETFLKNLPDLASSLSKCLMDPFDQIKIKCCEIINELSRCLRHEIGKHSSNIVKSLCTNLTHQKFKVRRTSLESLGNILVSEGAGVNFEQAKVVIKARYNDKKKQVREACLQCTAKLLRYMSPKYLKQHEATLIGFLLLGLQDGELAQKTMIIIDQVGGQLKKQDEGENTEMINEGDEK